MSYYFNKKYRKTLDILKEIKRHIEDNYKISEMSLNENKKEINCSTLSFKLLTDYYDVPVKLSRNPNYQDAMHMSLSFKHERPQRRSGPLQGYAPCVYTSYGGDKENYLDNIRIDVIDKEFEKILLNIQEDGTWCDESNYDD
ncbi:hypothetical protein [Bacillus velezensis]|uniref:hypothetical protein n=1 Tax=Bacillus velezensis TaxID=492670 RepID=UPI0035C6ECEC